MFDIEPDNRRLEYVMQRDRERQEAWLRFIGLTAEAYQSIIYQYTFTDTFKLVKIEPLPEYQQTFEKLERLRQMLMNEMHAHIPDSLWGRGCDDVVSENERLNRMENLMMHHPARLLISDY
jgi:hypothetical protein